MRKHSLKDDRADDEVFRHPRDKHAAYNLEMEYHQYCPHFFTPDRAYCPIEGLYRGASVFLICNGPSFAALDHSQLTKPGIMTFGINNGPRTFRPNFWTCVDDPVRFIKSIWLDPKITKFVPQSHFDKNIFDNEKWEIMDWKVRDCPNVLGYMRNEKFHAERFLTESSLNWGNHADYGGGRTVMLPSVRILYLLGFRKIYLLGCDMKMTENLTYHFDEQRTKGAVNCNMSTYDRLKNDYFPALKPHFQEMGLEIYNCNPDSELKVFDYVPFESAIKEATEKLGDIANERTYGMYTSPEEKKEFKNEPSVEQKKNIELLNQIRSGNTEIIRQIPMPPPKQPKQPKPTRNIPDAISHIPNINNPKNVISQEAIKPVIQTEKIDTQINNKMSNFRPMPVKPVPIVKPTQRPITSIPIVTPTIKQQENSITINAVNVPEVVPEQIKVNKVDLVQMPSPVEQPKRKIPPMFTKPPNEA